MVTTKGRARLSRRGHSWLLAVGLVATVALWQGLDNFAHSHGFLINRTPSLPNWAFWVERGALPVRGEIAFFAPPRSPLVLRHFGKDAAGFGKIAYGVGGDLVERHGKFVFVRPRQSDGSFASNVQPVGELKPLTKAGEVLEPGPVGVIPQGCYYMGSPHRDGFDSRYSAVGFVCARQIVAVARKVLL